MKKLRFNILGQGIIVMSWGGFTAIDPYNLKMEELLSLLNDPQQLNSYAYSRNNPIILVDIDGNGFVDFVVQIANNVNETIQRAQSVAGFTVGAVGEAINMVQSTAKAIANPVETAQSTIAFGKEAYQAGKELATDYIQNPAKTVNEVKTGLEISAKEWANQSFYEKGKDIGKLTVDAVAIGKSANLKATPIKGGLEISGNKYSVVGKIYTKSEKGAGISIRNTSLGGHPYQQRIFGLDIHTIRSVKNLPLPHLHFGKTVDAIRKHWPWQRH